MKNTEDTICAIATGKGMAALAIVRMSGPLAFKIASQIFSLFDQDKKPISLDSHVAKHGYIFDPISSNLIDEVVLTPYKGPNSYTGEDLVEISSHGSDIIANTILMLMISQGARLAKKGEFTQRAFLNGKIDLTQAEAVLDLIQAKTVHQGRLALSALSGHLGKQINAVRKDLIALLTRITAGIDFPDEIGDIPEPDIEGVVRQNIAKLDELTRTARAGNFLRSGLKIAIIGKPNVGKSSLLNQLLKYERAIVTDVPGTTRDSLEELIDLNGIPVTIVDTAGIRHTDDQVEKIGIERTKQAIDAANLVLVIHDLETHTEGEEFETILQNKPYLLIGNKIDLPKANKKNIPDLVFTNCIDKVFISAKTGENLDSLLASIEKWVFQNNANKDMPSLNSRQTELCIKAQKALDLVQETQKGNYPQDCLATDLKSAIDALSEISGEIVSEEVITEVFANFCIGK